MKMKLTSFQHQILGLFDVPDAHCIRLFLFLTGRCKRSAMPQVLVSLIENSSDLNIYTIHEKLVVWDIIGS